jgi:hypothetical protein
MAQARKTPRYADIFATLRISPLGDAVPPRQQLRTANVMMGLGLLPLALVVVWTTAFFLTLVPGRPPTVPIIDPIGMIGLLLMSFIATLAIAAPGAFWSWWITHRHAELRSRTVQALRLLTVLVLASPFLLSYWLSTWRP